jgi:hypothetical protein
MKEKWHSTTSYPTHSLREYLAYQSVDQSESEQAPVSAPDRVEVEV